MRTDGALISGAVLSHHHLYQKIISIKFKVNLQYSYGIVKKTLKKAN